MPTELPVVGVGYGAFREGGSPPPPNFSRQIINAVVKPFRSSVKLPPFSILISSKEYLFQGIDSEEAHSDPVLVDRLLVAYCELKRKKGDSKEVVGSRLTDIEQETKDRHSSLDSLAPSSSTGHLRADLAIAPWPTLRLQTFAASKMATATPLEICHEIKIDHTNVKDLFARFQACTSEDERQRLAIINTLVREIVIHLEAVEVTLYKTFRSKGMSSEALEGDQKTHARIVTLVANVESPRTLDPIAYDSMVSEAVEAFLDHAREEERVRLPQLELFITQEENTKLTQDFLKARTTVPVRPLPHASHSGGSAEKVAFAAGKVRDALLETISGKREYVEVAQKHAAY
ncbi:hypothetical protein BDY24DRAFT_438850 [Mrakia frigida]|uniref:hemerythrin domain-containing protein n=1 Tax=Mrakia frigida TaxID=29902 RepID=UPI003FCC1EF7